MTLASGSSVLAFGAAPVLAACMAALAVPVGFRAPAARPRDDRVVPCTALCALAAALAVLGPGGLVVPASILGLASWAGWRLWEWRRRGRVARRTSARVRESMDLLASELNAGRPPAGALALMAAEWDLWRPVLAAHEVGADVPAAIRDASATPGARDLRLLAAAWDVSGRTGQGLAAAVGRVGADVAALERTRRVIDAELSSARATARLVAGLPIAAWLMGPTGVTGPPRFLLTQPAGWVCLAAGLTLALAGLWWIEALSARTESRV